MSLLSGIGARAIGRSSSSSRKPNRRQAAIRALHRACLPAETLESRLLLTGELNAPVLQDYFEPNNSLRQAIDIGYFAQGRQGLNIDTAGDEDWIRWRALDSGKMDFSIKFNNDQGDLDLEVCDAGGKILGRSNTGSNLEQVQLSVVAGSAYYIHIFGHDASVINPSYDLGVANLTPSENYAVLFAGGINASKNYQRYYDNTKNLYDTLTDTYNVPDDHIYILYADGTNPAADQSRGGSIINSDMSYATHVLSATRANLQTTLTTTIKGLVDSNDHFFFWSFDHGGGSEAASGTTGEEVLCGWGENISDEDLANWLGQISAGHSTYVFTQCFAGGMLDNLMPLSASEHGSAATNHYEASWGDSFAAAYRTGLQGSNDSHDVYEYAYAHDGNATGGEGPGGTWVDGVEHPWEATSSSFPIFHRNASLAPWIREILPLHYLPIWSELVIPYDQLVAGSSVGDPRAMKLSFRIESVDSGTLLMDGKPVVPGQTLVGYGDTLTWIPSPILGGPSYDFTDVVAFSMRAWNGESISDQRVPVSIHLDQSGQFPDAVDDKASVMEDSPTAINVLKNDLGASPLSVIGVGASMHGTVQLVDGKVIYTPARDFSGEDWFTYYMRDSNAGSLPDSAIVRIAVAPVNDPPEAYADDESVLADSSGSVLDVLANDFDAESKPLTWDITTGPYALKIRATSLPSHGKLVLNSNQTFTYTPDAGYTGEDKFTYVANDGQSDSNETVVLLHVVRAQMDFGDAPDRYRTLAASGGAFHSLPLSPNDVLRLGRLVDAENDGQPSPDALGDDNNPIKVDDEDGVTFTSPLVPGQMATVDVVVSLVLPGVTKAYLSVWMDFRRNGIWEEADRIFAALPVVSGINHLSFPVPAWAVAGESFARFRLGLGDAAMPPTGYGGVGEVEDYRIRIVRPKTPDYLEPNDSSRTAIDLGRYGQQRTGLSLNSDTDQDWYTWTAQDAGTITINLSSDQQEGNLRLEIYDAGGKLIKRSDGNAQQVSFTAAASSAYSFHIYDTAAAIHDYYDFELLLDGSAENYAVLFSGGGSAYDNHDRYYNNTKRLYQLLMDEYDLPADHIYVLFADGTNPAPDQDAGTIINSDMSYATNVLAATRTNLQTLLTVTLPAIIDSNDHLFVWTYDHGGGATGLPAVVDEERLTTYGSGADVSDEDLAAWLGDFDVGYLTMVFNQCFSGGMLDNFLPLASNQYGCAAANHYESSWSGSYNFMWAYLDALESHSYTHPAYREAYLNDTVATDGEGPGGTWIDGVEHPWEATSTSFRIFATDSSFPPFIYEVSKYRFIRPWTEAEISFDRLRSLTDAGDPEGRAVAFRIESILAGELLINGKLAIPGKSIVGPGDTLLWRPPLSIQQTAGQTLDAFTIRAFDGDTVSDVRVPVSIEFVDDTEPKLAQDDAVAIPEDAQNFPIAVLANDTGTSPQVVTGIGTPSHGRAQLVDSIIYYTPSMDYYGDDTLTYTMVDALGRADSAQITIKITPVNDPPKAYADAFTVHAYSIDNAIDVLANDVDVESKLLADAPGSPPYAISAIITKAPSHGTLTSMRDGTFRYTPTPGYSGPDSFNYKANDGQADSNETTAWITILPPSNIIEGTAGDDHVLVRLTPAGTEIEINFLGTGPLIRLPVSFSSSLSFNLLGGNDELTVDLVNGNPIPTGGIAYDGGPQNSAPGDTLIVVGTASAAGQYLPSGKTPGSGTVRIDSLDISFTGLEPIEVSHFATFTLLTPNSDDQLIIDSLAAGTNRIHGSSGGISFESLTFHNVSTFVVDVATNDSPGSDVVTIEAPGMVATGLGMLRLNAGAGSNQLVVNGGPVRLDTNAGVGGANLDLLIHNSAAVSFPDSQTLRSLDLSESAVLALEAAGTRFLRVRGLSIGTRATLDLFDNDMIIQTASATEREAMLKGVADWIGSARHDGAWDLPGITSSAAGADSSKLTGLAAIANFEKGAPIYTPTWQGQPVDANSVLVKYTFNGDADLNGMLDGSDYFFIDKGYLSRNLPTPPGGYRNGDFDYNGMIDGSDYFLIDKAFLAQKIHVPPAPLAAAAAPSVFSTRPIESARKVARLRISRERGGGHHPDLLG